jgi:hypothetical protein
MTCAFRCCGDGVLDLVGVVHGKVLGAVECWRGVEVSAGSELPMDIGTSVV